MCGKLNKAMYGTRDVAQNCEHKYSGSLQERGFVSGWSFPFVFFPSDRNSRLVVHGDDFILLGYE